MGLLSSAGVRYEKHFAEAFCSPDRADHLAGRHTEDHGIGDIIEDSADAPMLQSELTIAEVLKRKYGQSCKTACVGKWHLGTTRYAGNNLAPNRAGFDYFYGTERNLNNVDDPTVGYYNNPIIAQGEIISNFGQYVPTMMARAAIRWLRHFAGGPSGDKGYLYLPWHLPHSAYHRPPSDLYNTSTWVLPNPAALVQDGSTNEIVPYAKAMEEALDTHMAQVWNSIPAWLQAQTVLLVSSDNGTSAELLKWETYPDTTAYNGNHGKRSYFDPAWRVPAWAYGPMIASGGRTVTGLVQSCDWYSTTLELLGVTNWQDIVAIEGPSGNTAVQRSKSLVSTITSAGTTTSRQYAYGGIFAPNGYNRGLATGRRAITDGRYKMRWTDTTAFGSPTLWDLFASPKETAQVTDEIGTASIQATLGAAWRAFYETLPPLVV